MHEFLIAGLIGHAALRPMVGPVGLVQKFGGGGLLKFANIDEKCIVFQNKQPGAEEAFKILGRAFKLIGSTVS